MKILNKVRYSLMRSFFLKLSCIAILFGIGSFTGKSNLTADEKRQLFAKKADPTELTKTIIQSPNDKNKYRYIELDNGLKAILVSDETMKNSVVSVSVKVGSFSDPFETPGLAHFLEHMLFLGSKKYPAPDEYMSYLAKNGGFANAFVVSEATTYFFSIPSLSLSGALDRFSRFFIDPLFNENFVQRELNAVNAEYSIQLNNDFLKGYYVEKNSV